MLIRNIALTIPVALFISALPSALAAPDCSVVACVDVYTQNGQIVIEAKKGNGPSEKVIPKKVRKRITSTPIFKKPTVVKPATPKPYVPKAIVKRRIAKRAAKVISTPATSLGDRLVELVPTGGVSYQPSFQPLVNVPVFFWCDLPPIFKTKVKIIGETIDVVMRPGFTWSFGDGTFESTTDPGAAYPDGKITHTYSKAGTYIVTLITSWNGTFAHNGVERSITGDIKKISTVSIKIVTAPTRFVN
ncbi:unannotated protein [freshwater metagenome]|uniref:Unannotated protein n=1 Tax=freshwater metagenome TaxID=449393 RepID=A0A6J7EE60_9ZZZZ|nr:hypothetical protein [Actinomycetota bacterium]